MYYCLKNRMRRIKFWVKVSPQEGNYSRTSHFNRCRHPFFFANIALFARKENCLKHKSKYCFADVWLKNTRIIIPLRWRGGTK